ncbi:MAG: hypothetical protein V1668_03395 [Patescibacteria group bacterium]
MKFESGKKNSNYGLLFWFHLIIIIVSYISWLLFSWWLVIIGAVLLQIQHIIAKGCVLTRVQFGEEKNNLTFIAFCLETIGFKFNRSKVKIATRFISPLIVIVLALFLRVVLHVKPLIF